jgi:metal-responsive CopG/Arc/MetJ family transcriptional regulator
MKTIKTAVSLPSELYLKAEKMRKKLNKSRSEMVADALARLVKDIETREAEARYAAAYKAMPETPEEIAEADAWPHDTDSDDEDWEEPDASR